MPQTKGEGSIIRLEGTSKADCRLWRLRFNMDDGTRRERRFRGSHTAARRELERFRSQLESPQEEKPPCPTFAEYSAHWLELRRQSGDVRAQTLMKDGTRIRNLCCHFGEMRLDEITRDKVKTGIAAIRNGENLSGRVLKGSTMNDMHGCFRQIMQEAAYDGIIPANPVSTVKPPKKDTPKKKALSLEEFLDFARKLDLMPLDGHTMGVRLCVMCGLRRGEAVGLDWGAVYPDHIRVVQAVEAKTGRVAKTKTENGVRAVPLMPPIAQALARWREMQEFALHGMGIEQTPETPVVTSTVGTRMDAGNLYGWWKSNAPRLFGIDCTLHELRHTFITLLANSGASAQAVKSLAGWGSIAMADTYVHADEGADRAAFEAMERRLGLDTPGRGVGDTSSGVRNVPQSAANSAIPPNPMELPPSSGGYPVRKVP